MSEERKPPRENNRCCEDNCPFEWTYDIPHHYCDWHWALWFNHGDVHQALIDVREDHERHGIVGDQLNAYD